MALLLEKQLPSGVVVSYHRILSINVNFNRAGLNEGVTGPLCTVEIGEYLSKEARDAGSIPVRTEVRSFVSSDDIKQFCAPLYRMLSAPMTFLDLSPEENPSGDPQPARPYLGYEGAGEA